jgi:hypothetical protein
VATGLAILAMRLTSESEPSFTRWAALSAAAGFGAIVATIVVQRATRRRLEVFETWFRYTSDDETVLARWDQVQAFYTPSVRFRRFLGRPEYRLVAGGHTLDIGSRIGASAELGEMIVARTTEAAIDRARARIASGRPARFGPITLNQDGIEIRRGRTLRVPFVRIRDQRLNGKQYVLTSLDRRRAAVIPVSKIPNVMALNTLVEQSVRPADTRH